MHFQIVAGIVLLCGSAHGFSMGMNLAVFYPRTDNDHFKAGIDFTNTTNPWKDEVVKELKNFDCIRMMKLSGVGGGILSGVSKWTQRHQKTNEDQWSSYKKGDGHGTAYEWQIVLATLAGADLWTNIPPDATTPSDNGTLADFPVRLAILIKTGVDTFDVDLGRHMTDLSSLSAADFVKLGGRQTVSPLPESRKVYIEYGNERWTEGWQTSLDWGTALDLQYNGRHDGHLYTAWAQLQIWRAFHAVFGKDSPRVYRLCAGKMTNPWVTEAHLSIFDDARYNPEGFKLMGYAVAPYAPQGNSKSITNVSDLYPWLSKLVPYSQQHQALLQPRGIQLVGYEGGEQIFPDTLHINNDPAMGPFYTDFWNTLAPYFDGVFNHFVYARYDYGLKQYPGQPDKEAVKWTATMQWYKKHTSPQSKTGLLV